MSNYIKQFVTGHGIKFEISKRNSDAFNKALIKWPEIYSDLKIDNDSIVMLCGAKNNGKSSLLRYIVNKYNSETGCNDCLSMDVDPGASQSENKSNERYAYFVDFDPGQPELNTPGIVSAHKIFSHVQQLVSPTYLNILQHEPVAMASVGGTNMSVNPKMYIRSCRFVYKKVKENQRKSSKKRPIFINTMGHIRNIGLALLMDLIKICRPTNLIVINIDNDAMRTIYADLSPEVIKETPASFYYETSNQSKGLNYEYKVYNLNFSFVDSTSVATKNRTALQLAYFGSLPEALYKPIMQLEPRWLSLDSIIIYCVSSYPLKEGIVLELLYHSWVHLVELVESNVVIANSPNENHSGKDELQQSGKLCNIIDEICEHMLFGCGIVIEIDLESRKLALITPLDQDTLDMNINCVIKPLSIQVPHEMIQATS